MMDSRHDTTELSSSFDAVHIVEPSLNHSHTAIMLHGRGSNGPEFADELSETVLPGHKNLIQKFPSWRWVFLSSKTLWSSAFEESLPAWFEAHSLTSIEERQDLQMDGIRDAVGYIQSIVDQEVERLGGNHEKLVLAGISQGGAIGMWELLCQQNLDVRFGAFVGASTWLPFAKIIESLLVRDGDPAGRDQTETESVNFVKEMMSAWGRYHATAHDSTKLLSTPIFLGHGTDDATVGVELGRHARRVLSKIGFQVEWKEYLGAELEGHWLKVPEEVDDIANFLATVTAQ
ncbi:Alpha/Beta hydrolase protein [Cladorrhinum samala]|uniref:Alpha/Beta hydrolase protein n=1 Tax=Cladorrhinum samala TaxID=585594 RepID=A0AAV9I5E6_9PEZI|nr:Alpha/Beta hydrolase protein [Cladorrhinum samala]